MDSEDAAYRKNVRNMSLVLAAIVITIFAALFIPPYVNPLHNVYSKSVTADSPFGFTMHLELNATTVTPSSGILLSGWVNSTYGSVRNITAANAWAYPFQHGLWGRLCTAGWPIGIGVMSGHYAEDNYTLGTLIPIPLPLVACPVPNSAPAFFVFEAYSSRALVTVNGNPAVWTIQSTLAFRDFMSGYMLSPGVYTAVLADEWGDVLTSIFLVS